MPCSQLPLERFGEFAVTVGVEVDAAAVAGMDEGVVAALVVLVADIVEVEAVGGGGALACVLLLKDGAADGEGVGLRVGVALSVVGAVDCATDPLATLGGGGVVEDEDGAAAVDQAEACSGVVAG
jgi:hypothetical protein